MGTVSVNDTAGGVSDASADVVATGVGVDYGEGVNYPPDGSPGSNILAEDGSYLITEGGSFLIIET